MKIIEKDDMKVLEHNGEVFDWQVSDVDKLKIICSTDSDVIDSYIGSIKANFINCLSDFLGKPITFKELNDNWR